MLVEGEAAQNAMRWEDYTQTAIDPERRLHHLVRRRLPQERRDELLDPDRRVSIARLRRQTNTETIAVATAYWATQSSIMVGTGRRLATGRKHKKRRITAVEETIPADMARQLTLNGLRVN